jgi:hypothetical protein
MYISKFEVIKESDAYEYVDAQLYQAGNRKDKHEET